MRDWRQWDQRWAREQGKVRERGDGALHKYNEKGAVAVCSGGVRDHPLTLPFLPALSLCLTGEG